MDGPDLRHIVVTWDLDEGTGLAVRYGEMPAERAAVLLTLAARIVSAHADLLDELRCDTDEVAYELGFDEYCDDDEDEDE
jgi:hypothetical protein